MGRGRLSSKLSLSRGAATYMWMLLARRMPIPRLLALAGLCQLWNGAPLLSAYRRNTAFFLFSHIMCGVAQGAVEPLLIGFSFFDQWAGHVAVAAKRAALIEPARIIITLSMTALVINGNIPSSCSKPHATCPVMMTTLSHLAALGLRSVLAIQFLLSLLCFALPIKHSLRLPRRVLAV